MHRFVEATVMFQPSKVTALLVVPSLWVFGFISCSATQYGVARNDASAAGGNTGAGGGGGGSGVSGDAAADGRRPDAALPANADGSVNPPGSPCAPLVLNSSVSIATFETDQFVWQDSRCKPRKAAMVRVGGGYVRQFVYDVDGKPRTATGTGAGGHTGWGYTVNHWGNTATVGKGVPGTFKTLFVGRHHAVHEYRFSVGIAGKQVPVIQHWLFATGRDNPVLATTYDVSAIPPGTLGADTRTPYGDIAWDGDENAARTVVDGVGWGDRYKFITTSAPLTMNSKWDYTQPNVVPYVLEWTSKTDAEMGAVQTQTWQQKDAGGYWFYDSWGKTSDNPPAKKQGQVGLMTPTWNWTYQLNQYELCIENPACVDDTTASHRLAWGANYGALGGTFNSNSPSYPAYGDDKQIVGHPFHSYSVFMVLGKHSATPVFRQMTEIETVQGTQLSASAGTVKTMGPGGVGRTDLVALSPPGYDQRYGVWSVEAAGNRVALKVTVDKGALENPVLVVSNYTGAAAPAVKIDGAAKTAEVDYLASVDPTTKQVWITFRAAWSGTHDLALE
jgi:hypothetical protein